METEGERKSKESVGFVGEMTLTGPFQTLLKLEVERKKKKKNVSLSLSKLSGTKCHEKVYICYPPTSEALISLDGEEKRSLNIRQVHRRREISPVLWSVSSQ